MVQRERETAAQEAFERAALELGPQDQSAFAAHAELGYTFEVAWSPRVAAQFDHASGTDDPTGSKDPASVPLFGARRFDLVATGISGPFVRSNILSPGVRVGFVPPPEFRVDCKLSYRQLAEAEGVFVRTVLSDPSGDAGRYLGTDVEFRVRWDPASWLGVELGYGH